jgi:hypothetical protein
MLTTFPTSNLAREAESLTLDYERNRLKALGIDKEPKWMSLDDTFAGYDVLSYNPGEFGPINRIIQVNVTLASPFRFILCREEWEHAQRFGAACLFHVWNMQKTPPVLYEITSDQVGTHIPYDNGNGRWKTVEIPLDI